MNDIRQYVNAVSSALNANSGEQLRDLLRLSNPVASKFAYSANQINRGAVKAACSERLPDPWNGIIQSYINFLLQSYQGNYLAAYNALLAGEAGGVSAAPAMVDVCRDQRQLWLVKPLIEVCSIARVTAHKADEQILRQGMKSSGGKLEECARFLQNTYSAFPARGEGQEQRKLAAVAIGTVLMKAYFTLNTINNCRNIIKAIEGPGYNLFDSLPAAHRVAYKYYTGRMAIYDDNYQKAADDLQYAFKFCHVNAQSNIRKILRYLIPIKMLRGELPSEELLSRFQLPEYKDILLGVRTGDVGLLRRSIDQHQIKFIQAGTYFVVEKLMFASYRRLFKRCQLTHMAANPAKGHQVPLWLFQSVLSAQGLELDMDEIECIMANLIYGDYIKGYIAHKNKIVVVSKDNAFPALQLVKTSGPDV